MGPMAIPRYQASGKFTAGTIPLMLVLGGAVAAVLAAVYQVFVDWVPFIYINFFATLAFGFLVGLALGACVRWSHCRSAGLALALGVVVGLVGVGASHWVAYELFVREMAASDKVPTEMRQDPELVRAMVRVVAPYEKYVSARVESGWSLGSHGSGGLPLSGWFVYLMWVIEGAMVVGLAAMVATGAAAEPYCEACRLWMPAKPIGSRPVAADDLARLTHATNLFEFAKFAMAGGPSDSRLEYKLCCCERCLQNHYLTVKHHRDETDSKGKVSTKSTDLLENVCITQSEIDAIRSSLEAAQAAAVKDAPPATPA